MDQTNMPIGVKFAVIHRAFRREMDALLREKDVTGAQFGALRALAWLEAERGGGTAWKRKAAARSARDSWRRSATARIPR